MVRSATFVGTGVVNAATLLDLELAVVGGGFSLVADDYVEHIRKAVDERAVNAFARVDNLFDRKYVGSVIVNDGNSRFFEPAPGRSWLASANASYRF